MLYSVGKDSSVMLHLARKAFYPAAPPFPFLHIATGWDFQALLNHRDRMADAYGLELLVHGNTEATEAGVNPFDTETGEYSRLMLTEALKTALDLYGFDAALGGGRRGADALHQRFPDGDLARMRAGDSARTVGSVAEPGAEFR